METTIEKKQDDIKKAINREIALKYSKKAMKKERKIVLNKSEYQNYEYAIANYLNGFSATKDDLLVLTSDNLSQAKIEYDNYIAEYFSNIDNHEINEIGVLNTLNNEYIYYFDSARKYLMYDIHNIELVSTKTLQRV